MNLMNAIVIFQVVIITCRASEHVFKRNNKNSKVQEDVQYSNGTNLKLSRNGPLAVEYDSKKNEEFEHPFIDYLENTNTSRPIFFKQVKENTSNSAELKLDVKNTTFPYAMRNESAGFNLTFDEKAREDGFELGPAEDSPSSVLVLASSGSDTSICTGTLLTEEWVLTAAHCLEAKSLTSVEIYAGGISLSEYKSQSNPKSQTLSSVEHHMHPKYTKDGSYDVAVIKTEQKFKMTKTVQTMPISTEPWTHYSYVKCKFTGFGNVYFSWTSSHDQERKTHYLYVKNPCLCNFLIKAELGRGYARKSICTKPENDYGICSGDSGGGLICGKRLVATATYLLSFYDTNYCEGEADQGFSCGSDKGLSAFLDTCPHLTWINSYVKLFNEGEISSKCVDVGSAQTVRPQPDVALVLVTIALFRWF